MRTWLIVVSLAASIAGCDCAVCVRDTWCDGDKLMRCEVSCPRSTYKSQEIGGCVKKESFVDCAEQGLSKLGVEQTCAAVADYHECVDKPVTACGRLDGQPLEGRRSTHLACSGDHILACHGTGAGDGLGVQVTQLCDGPARTCHPNHLGGLSCVDSPKVGCEPAQYPQCAGDGGSIVYCVGTDAGGYFTRTEGCIGDLRCRASDAGNRCDQIDRPPPDGGTDAGTDGGSDGG